MTGTTSDSAGASLLLPPSARLSWSLCPLINLARAATRRLHSTGCRSVRGT
jgi:hypothetical protein